MTRSGRCIREPAPTLALVNWRSHPLNASERYPGVRLGEYAGRVDRVLLSSEPFHLRPHGQNGDETMREHAQVIRSLD